MKFIKNILTLMFFAYVFQYINGQELLSKGYFRPPLDIEMILSGNFAEIRSDHFHSGIDIKTQGVSGLMVYAAADGYISRIKIEAGGYGKTLYLAHPNGKTSVYAHLDRFRDDINDYVKTIQYTRNRHVLSIYPEKNEWPVKKGELIAYSGNSGYSSGPHLHFEIRNTANQDPENVLLYGFNIRDTIAPKFLTLWMYSFIPDGRSNIPAGSTGYNLKLKDGRYATEQPDPVVTTGPAGFGIEAYDYLNGSNNKCGLYSIELMLDDKRLFYMKMNDFSFNESRYVNSFIDYRQKHTNDRNIQKLFLDPNNSLSMYEEVNGLGLINISEPDTHLIRIIIKDTYQNASELIFNVTGSPWQSNQWLKQDHPIRYDQAHLFDSDGVCIRLPAFSLYTDINFSYKKDAITGPYLSDIHHIHDPGVPVHNNYEIDIRPVSIHDTLKSKAIILSIDEEGKSTFVGGEWKGNYLQAQVNHFGTFAVGLDTLPPLITPLNIGKGSNMSGQSSARFRVRDDQSGIKSYDGYIDNKWALFEYDLKYDLIYYTFDKKRLPGETKHEMELYIIDNRDNLSYYYTEFYW